MPRQDPLSVRQPMIKMNSSPILSHSKLEIAPHLAYEAQSPPARNNNNNNKNNKNNHSSSSSSSSNNNNKATRARGSWAIDITEAAEQARNAAPANASQRRQPRQAPPIAPLAPRDARPAEELWDLAHFLRETGPQPTATTTLTANPANSVGKPARLSSTQKKLVKRVFRLSSSDNVPSIAENPTTKRSLADFKPANASQRVSKDGKRYLHIMVPEEATAGLSGGESVNQSQTSTARVSRDGGPRTDVTVPKSSHEGAAANTTGRSIETNAEKRDSQRLGSDRRSSARLARNKESFQHGNTSERKVKPTSKESDISASGEQQSRQSSDPSVSKDAANKHTMDARTALSSHPTSRTRPGPAPSKPLPTVPDTDALGVDDTSNPRDSQIRSSNVFTKDSQRPGAVPTALLNRSNSERSSNQGVRRTPYDATPRASSAMDTRNPVDAAVARRHQQNLSVDSAANMGAFSVQGHSRANQSGSVSSHPPSSRVSSSSEMNGGRPSITQQERKEKTRARKLRDLQRHRPSIDEVVERPAQGGENQQSNERLKMSFSPVMTVASISPELRAKSLKKPPKLNLQQDLHASSLSHRPPLSRHIRNGSSPTIKSAAAYPIQTVPNQQRMSTDSLKPLASPLSFKDRTPPGFDHTHKHLILQDSQTEQHFHMDKALPELIAPEERSRTSLFGGDRGRSLPASPNLVQHLQGQTQGSLDNRLATRLDDLERENRLLEAALMAVLKTNGKLNNCLCGGSAFDQLPNFSKQSRRPIKDIQVAPDEIPPGDHHVAEPGQEATWLHPHSNLINRNGKKFSTASSIVSAGGVSATSAAEQNANRDRQTLGALDLYMATRSGARSSMTSGGAAGARSSTGTLPPAATAAEM